MKIEVQINREPVGTIDRLSEVVDVIYAHDMRPLVDGEEQNLQIDTATGSIKCNEGYIDLFLITEPDELIGYRTIDESEPIYQPVGPDYYWVHRFENHNNIMKGKSRWEVMANGSGLDYNAKERCGKGQVFGPWETFDEAHKFQHDCFLLRA